MSKSKNSLKLAEEKLRAVFQKNKIKEEDVLIDLDPKFMKESWPHWPSGSIAVDYLIGGIPNNKGILPCPGIPKGKIINLYGLEASGKSTLALTIAASLNKLGAPVAYIDVEHEVDLRYAKTIGVAVEDSDLFRLAQPETMEQAMAVALAYISAGVPLVVWDSVGASPPQGEVEKLEKEIGATAKIGALAKKWGEVLPIYKSRCAKTGTIFLGISQMRANISAMGYGEKYNVQGGNAWKYFSALRMKMKRVAWDKGDVILGLENKPDKGVVGALIKVKLDKCKVSNQQNMEVPLYLRWGVGIDDLRTCIQTAMDHKLIKKKGAWLTWTLPTGEEVKLQGVEKMRSEILDNESYFSILKTQVQEILSNQNQEKSEAEEEEEFFEEEEEDFLGDELEELLTVK